MSKHVVACDVRMSEDLCMVNTEKRKRSLKLEKSGSLVPSATMRTFPKPRAFLIPTFAAREYCRFDRRWTEISGLGTMGTESQLTKHGKEKKQFIVFQLSHSISPKRCNALVVIRHIILLLNC